MTIEANIRTVLRVFDEVVNLGRLDVIDEIYVEDMVDHEPLPGAPDGRPGVRYSIGGFIEGLPDLHVETHDVSAHGDYVVVHNTWRGTHTGSLAGLKPTGRSLEVSGVVVWRLRDGRISERWAMGVESGLMEQLGMNPLITKGLERRRRRATARTTGSANPMSDSASVVTSTTPSTTI